MNSGAMHLRIEIQSKTVTYDSYNQPVETWATSQTVWAEAITGNNGKLGKGRGEFYAAQKLMAETSVVFRVRYNSTVALTNRVKWGSRIFEILYVNDLALAHIEILLSCKEVM